MDTRILYLIIYFFLVALTALIYIRWVIRLIRSVGYSLDEFCKDLSSFFLALIALPIIVVLIVVGIVSEIVSPEVVTTVIQLEE